MFWCIHLKQKYSKLDFRGILKIPCTDLRGLKQGPGDSPNTLSFAGYVGIDLPPKPTYPHARWHQCFSQVAVAVLCVSACKRSKSFIFCSGFPLWRPPEHELSPPWNAGRTSLFSAHSFTLPQPDVKQCAKQCSFPPGQHGTMAVSSVQEREKISRGEAVYAETDVRAKMGLSWERHDWCSLRACH